MKLAAVLLLVTVSNLLVISQALDDDEPDGDQKYTVSFFQFNPKDLAIGGGHRKERTKKNFKRSDADTLPKPVNTTIINSTNNNVAADKSSKESTDLGNSTVVSVLNGNNASVSTNGTAVNNSSDIQPQDSNTTAPVTRDSDIMNTLINMAMKKNLSATSNDVRNQNASDTHADININGKFVPSNTSLVDPTFNFNFKNESTNSTAATKATVPTKKDEVAHSQDVLNPNPQPSEHEAMLNLKHPKQLENRPHDPNIHAENTTKMEETDNQQATTTNKVSMVKTTETKDLMNAEIEPTKEIMNKTSNSTVSDEETEEETQQKKIAKDKLTNMEIKENAKDIKPVLNTVGKINASIHNPIKDDTKFVKETPARSKVDHVDEGKIKHRNNVAKFVPLYKTSAKDHKLSFQIGSVKHPKHNTHPRCHACPMNSSYKECVKKSTLLECSQGLDNICFTKSTKKEGIITYQMGCANHNKCVSAKAFPCKDNREHCFTCCQYDRCNSSPHHGDYELDELNLAELSDAVVTPESKDTTKLDSTSAIDTISGSWMAYASTIIVVLVLHL